MDSLTVYWRKLGTVHSAVAITIAALGSMAAVLFGAWFFPSHADAPVPAPAITVSPVQSVQQSVQIAGTAVAPASEQAPALVLMVGADGRVDGDLTARAAHELAARGDAAAFSNDFVTRGFTRAFDGDASELSAIAEGGRPPLIVLGRVHCAYASHDTLSASAGLRQADAVLDLRIYQPRAGFATHTTHLTAAGAGYSEAAARTQAYERLAAQLRTAIAP